MASHGTQERRKAAETKGPGASGAARTVRSRLQMDSSPAQCAQTYLDLQEEKAFLTCLSPYFMHEHSSLLCAMGILSPDALGDIWRIQQIQTGFPTSGLLRGGPWPWPG